MELEKERQEWNDMYSALQKELQGLKGLLQEKESQM